MNPARLNGNDLTFTDLYEVVYRRRPVLPSGDARPKINAARAVVDSLVENNQLAYAVTTGVGGDFMSLAQLLAQPPQVSAGTGTGLGPRTLTVSVPAIGGAP